MLLHLNIFRVFFLLFADFKFSNYWVLCIVYQGENNKLIHNHLDHEIDTLDSARNSFSQALKGTIKKGLSISLEIDISLFMWLGGEWLMNKLLIRMSGKKI